LVAAEERRRAEEEARRVQAELEARRREAAAREAAAREAARSQPPSARATTTDPNAGSGPAASGAAAAVEEARRQLGKPYQYGAAGPDTFDCSGLTQWSWKAGGKALPHSSRAQYGATSRVALPNIKPGDLAFFGPSVSGIHHVGIYVGDGRMIEASRTGTPVRYASIYRSDMVGIGRVN
jgi:cell wall-associated NlpC family hydrolase